MGIPVLILGESGSGKSTSLRNFEQEEIGIFNVASKPLPFRKKLPTRNGATYASITKALSHPKGRTYAIDDSQALMAFALFNKAKETGYGKFTDIALDFYNLLQFIIQKTPSDCIVYFLHHTETSDTGRIKAKTVGRAVQHRPVGPYGWDTPLLRNAVGRLHHSQKSYGHVPPTGNRQ